MRIALLADPHLSLLPRNPEDRLLVQSRAIVRAAIDAANAMGPDVAVWLGDLTHEGTPEVREAFVAELSRLRTPSLQIVGNHDVESPTKLGFGRAIPIVQHAVLHWAGWTVVFIDTVVERSPHNPDGELTATDAALLREAVATAAGGPLLVFSHHPPRPECLHNPEAFDAAIAGHAGTVVSIAGHTHANRSERRGRLRLIERSSLIMYPIELHMLELSPGRLALEPVAPDVGAARDAARDLTLARGGEAVLRTRFGSDDERHLVIETQ